MVLGFGAHSAADEEPRGRPMATGRGGAGNMRSQSRSSSSQPVDADASAAAAYVSEHPPSVVSSGRGGVGNVRSPSRDPADRARLVQDELHEQEMQDEYRRAEANSPHYAPSGRGGRGNLHHEGSSLERGRGASTERDRGRKDGPVGTLLRSFSRSRSRDARTTESPARDPSAPAGPLDALAEGPEAGDSAEDLNR